MYVDQLVVTAALQGKVLILEGLEKAERNVLPVLNNLLENREMVSRAFHLLIPRTSENKLHGLLALLLW